LLLIIWLIVLVNVRSVSWYLYDITNTSGQHITVTLSDMLALVAQWIQSVTVQLQKDTASHTSNDDSSALTRMQANSLAIYLRCNSVKITFLF